MHTHTCTQACGYIDTHTHSHTQITAYLFQPIQPAPSSSELLFDPDHMRIYLQAKKLHYQPVTYDPESHDAFSLEACLAAYTSLNTLSGSNQLKCETCGKAKEQRNKV